VVPTAPADAQAAERPTVLGGFIKLCGCAVPTRASHLLWRQCLYVAKGFLPRDGPALIPGRLVGLSATESIDLRLACVSMHHAVLHSIL